MCNTVCCTSVCVGGRVFLALAIQNLWVSSVASLQEMYSVGCCTSQSINQSINFLHNMAVQQQGHVAGQLQANVVSLALLIICSTQWEQQTIMHQTNSIKMYPPHDERSVKDTTANRQSPIRLNIVQIPLKPQPHLPPLT